MHKINYLANNWLALKINNRTVKKKSKKFKGTVYDFGCGERPYESYILKIADKYIGVDWNETLHDLNADIIADLNKPLPIESEIADTVTSFQVLEHLHDPQMMLNEAYRILKKDGNIVLTVPFQWWVHEAPYDYFRYTIYGLKHIFKKAGFREINITPASGFFSTWILKMNYFSARFIKGPFFIRLFIRMTMTPLWYLGQLLAPILDRLDNDPSLETIGYVAVAKKK